MIVSGQVVAGMRERTAGWTVWNSEIFPGREICRKGRFIGLFAIMQPLSLCREVGKPQKSVRRERES